MSDPSPSSREVPLPPLPAREEPRIRRIAERAQLPPGWRLFRVDCKEHVARIDLVNPAARARARVTLAHPEVTAPAFARAPRTRAFAVLLQADPGSPEVDLLRDAIVRSAFTYEEGFAWPERPAPAPAPVRPPPPPPRSEEETRIAVMPDDGLGPPLGIFTDPPGVRATATDYLEVDEHLELVPYIDMGVRFDPAPMLDEALRLFDRFKPYQSDPRYGIKHWLGLALRAFEGDMHGAAQTNDSGAHETTRYRLTDIAALCPHTMAFLDRYMVVDRSHAISFLALAPGGEIVQHVDEDDHEVMISFNAALNMPEGCVFEIDLDERGEPDALTRTLPLSAGTALIVNVCRRHRVINRSDAWRIHLVGRGPLRFGVRDVLDVARRQNDIPDRATLHARLRAWYDARGLLFEERPDRPYARRPRARPRG